MRSIFKTIITILYPAFLTMGLWAIATNSRADEPGTLLLLVSQRNAENIAEAAHQFKQIHPKLEIVARTDLQITEYTKEELNQLLDSAGAIFATGLYGPSVAQLQQPLAKRRNAQLIVNSDHRLVGLSHIRQREVFSDAERLKKLAKSDTNASKGEGLADLTKAYPAQKEWLTTRAYWQAGGSDNKIAMMAYLFQQLLDVELKPEPPKTRAAVRWFYQGRYQAGMPPLTGQPIIAIIDHAGGARPADTRILRNLCQQATQKIGHQCISAVANWGNAAVTALKTLNKQAPHLTAIIMLQDFVVGGGEGRESATEIFRQLNVPVINAIKQRDRNAADYQLSADGIDRDKVYYQVAMPELQGAGQPLIIAHASDEHIDPLTGIRVQALAASVEGIQAAITRVKNWYTLQSKDNHDKRVAIVYYNHPPGRHNIGADNLDVPASLWQILQQLKAAGYDTGELPGSQEALLDRMQQQGVNLPRDAKALRGMASQVSQLTVADYRSWLADLPASVQNEMLNGPLGLLHEQLLFALDDKNHTQGKALLEHTFMEMHHLLEGLDHPARERAVTLLSRLENCYTETLSAPLAPQAQKNRCIQKAPTIIKALRDTGIEGLGGWGEPPGEVMVYDNQFLFPGIHFGKIFIGPQPPRGWEINEELLHANLAFPPPHQYLAFYHYLKNHFNTDVLVHLGRHSTYEFLPRRAVGLGIDDYSRIIAGDIPGIYPYIVDGVGEGIQAKRRGLAVMVDHLTPPLKSTALYDELLQLRQLVESFESHHGSDDRAVSTRLMQQIRTKIKALNLEQELAESMSAELAIMGIGFEEVDDDLLVHEIGHYLTTLQERFMPLGLHVYGKQWSDRATKMMVESMAPADARQKQKWQSLLKQSPAAEIQGLLAGLNGEFVAPGPGNDPIRSPQSLPTGRNFYALDNSLIPSRVAWALGQQMAKQARQDNSQAADKREAIVLWASDVVRDEGVMIAFGLDMLGLEPVWNSRGLVTGLKHQASIPGRVRRDVVFTTSGLFRDLYGKQMQLLSQATLLALDASSDLITRDYPALTVALQATLEAVKPLLKGGHEPLATNQVAAHWVQQTQELLHQGYAQSEAGAIASYRVFGDAPGAYGAGINRMTERSGAWQHRSELADVYLRRLGHSYDAEAFGKPAQRAFEMQLKSVENTYFGRSSNLYGLIDNNDAFDYLGGLSLAVETLSGEAPNNYVIDYSDPENFNTQALSVALRQEFRGRFLNPEWLTSLMEHGYAGARTMGSEFLEYLWGWQITNPTIVDDWAWQEVKAVYIDDRYNLQLDQFLAQGHNVHVKTNMLSIMLVAIHKGFWQAEKQTRKALAGEFASLVTQHGLPGSGHTDPDHPMLPWLEQYLSPEDWHALEKVIQSARPAISNAVEVHRIKEISQASKEHDQSAASEKKDTLGSKNMKETPEAPFQYWAWLAGFLVLFIVGSTMMRAIFQAKHR